MPRNFAIVISIIVRKLSLKPSVQQSLKSLSHHFDCISKANELFQIKLQKKMSL